MKVLQESHVLQPWGCQKYQQHFRQDMPESRLIDLCWNLLPDYPDKPKAPVLSKRHSEHELEQYVLDFDYYQKADADYKEQLSVYIEEKALLLEALENFIKERTGFERVPEQYRAKVWHLAWDLGHSSGYNSVQYYLEQLIEIFL